MYSERGVSRSAAVVIAYIMDKEGISYYEAYIKVCPALPSTFIFFELKTFYIRRTSGGIAFNPIAALHVSFRIGEKRGRPRGICRSANKNSSASAGLR